MLARKPSPTQARTKDKTPIMSNFRPKIAVKSKDHEAKSPNQELVLHPIQRSVSIANADEMAATEELDQLLKDEAKTTSLSKLAHNEAMNPKFQDSCATITKSAKYILKPSAPPVLHAAQTAAASP